MNLEFARLAAAINVALRRGSWSALLQDSPKLEAYNEQAAALADGLDLQLWMDVAATAKVCEDVLVVARQHQASGALGDGDREKLGLTLEHLAKTMRQLDGVS